MLASYFTDNKVYLYEALNKNIVWLTSHFSNKENLHKPSINSIPTNIISINNISPIKPHAPEEYYQHSEMSRTYNCKDTALGTVKYKKVGDIYTWVDEKEVVHFSSTPPVKGDFRLLSYAGEKVFDYFTLDFNTENLPYDFNEKLTLKLNKLFEVYGQLIDHVSLKKVDINLLFYASQHSFEQAKIHYNMPISDNVAGFYSSMNNQAHLLLTSYAATMRTATHEATHAINRGIIGYSPRWLNEGLAEYSEYITVANDNAKVYPNITWIKKNQLSEFVLPLSTLLTANGKDWNSALKTRFYATSWAFIYFMMDHPQRKDMLAKRIKNEQRNLCDVIVTDINEIEKTIGTSVNILQKQFNHWVTLTFNAHPI